jgi:ornithine carbamoyltransferase
MTVRHFLEVDDLSGAELGRVLDLAADAAPPRVLEGQAAALLFEKPSLRTRNSTEVAVVQLGGHPVTMRGDEVGLGSREPIADLGRVLSRYHALIAARVFAHRKLEELAAASTVPVVNLLSDDAHPCQALADLLTVRQRFGHLDGLTLAYVGDFNNVARSLAVGAALAGVTMHASCPEGFGPSAEALARVGAVGRAPVLFEKPAEAVAGAHAVYTDVWTSMGQEEEAAARQAAFRSFTVDADVMAAARADAVFLHCLPAHRGEEVTAEVVDGPQSAVWDQAENRLHAIRGLFLFLLGR